MSFSYALTWCYRWDGWTHLRFSAPSQRHNQRGERSSRCRTPYADLWGNLRATSHRYAPPPHTPSSLTNIDCYIDDVISAVQGGGLSNNTESLTAQSVFSDEFPPSLPREAKDSVSVNNLLAGRATVPALVSMIQSMTSLMHSQCR